MDSRPHLSRTDVRENLTACRTAACLALLTLLALLTATAAPAAPATPKLHTFHIDAGDATFTLNEFSRQSSLQLLFDFNVVRGRKTRAISGEFAAEEALRQMLTDTGLVFDFVNERTLAVTVNEHQGSPGSAVADASTKPPAHTHTAETQRMSHKAPGSAGPGVDLTTPELQEITILGTHVRGGAPVGEHVVRLGREDINSNPNATVQDLLRTIPQTFGGGPTEDTHLDPEARTNSGLGSGVNLRGLGAGATLVLINGKRMAPSGLEAAFSDIENIPLSAIDHIDILSDGASGLYGSDAVGGVVNFVMRDNFTGAETLVRGGSGTQNTLAEYQVAQTLGSHWDGGNAMVSLEFYKRGDLPAYARRYADSNLTSLGGSNFDQPFSNPGNILLNGRSYAIPAGQNGTQLTAGDLNPGTLNLANKYAGAQLLPDQKRWSLYGSGKQALNDTVSFFGNALVSRREAQESTGGAPANLPIPASNPFHPSGLSGPISVEYNFLDDVGAESTDVLVNNINVTFGLNINLSTAWKMSLYGNFAQERESQLASGLVDQSALMRALADPDPATAFNPFGDGSNTNPLTLRSLAAVNRLDLNSQLRSVNTMIDGPITHLPGGDVKLALGIDRRNQIFASTQLAASAGTPELAVHESRNVTAAFGEIRVPLFGRENGGTGYRRLEVSLAQRYENYSDFGHAATPKLGLSWSPIDTLAFRGTWGRSIRAPTLADLNTTANSIGASVFPDQHSPTGFSRVLLEAGNRPGITIERARSWTTGFDVDSARWLPGLTFSATYFNINFQNRIQAPTFGLNVLNDPSLASLVTRNPTPDMIAAACNTGALYAGPAGTTCAQYPATVLIDARRQNLAAVHTSGVDLSAAYEHHWAPGTLKTRIDGTYLLDFKQQALPEAPVAQLLNTQNNPINIKLRGMLSWQQVHWGATVGINFQNHYKDTVSDRDIRSFTTFDAQLKIAPPGFGLSPLQNTVLELNAINVFNSSPPFLNNGIAGLGYDQENADPTGRLLSIQVRKSW